MLPAFLDNRDKNEILKDVLNEKIEYQKWQSNLVFIPWRSETDYLHAQIGKRATITRSLPSEHSFEEVSEPNYPHCELFFYFSPDNWEGQKIAFEVNSTVFQNVHNQINIFSDELNKKLFNFGYAISISPVLEKNSFWSVVKQYEGKIEKIAFSFAVPNLFNIKDSLNDDLKETWAMYNATNIKTELENKAGNLQLNESNQFLRQSVDYTEKWWWEYEIRIKWATRKIIKSSKNIKTRDLGDIEFELKSSDPVTFLEAIKRIFK